MTARPYNEAGVYVFRTRRPGAIGRMPYAGFPLMIFSACVCAHVSGVPWWIGFSALVLSPRHTAYVGETLRVQLRKRDHLQGSVVYNQLPKPWVDLSPSHYFIPVPPFKPVLRTVETLLIFLLWPVYNHQKNLWNPRRIPIKAAKRQRGSRDVVFWSFNFRLAHLMIISTYYTLAAAHWGWFPW